MSREIPTTIRGEDLGAILVITPPHVCNAQLAVAAVRSGATGLLDLGVAHSWEDRAKALGMLKRDAQGACSNWGVAWDVLGQADRFPRALNTLRVDPRRGLTKKGTGPASNSGLLERTCKVLRGQPAFSSPDPWPVLLLAGLDFREHDLEEALRQARDLAERVIAEVYSVDDSLAAQQAGFDGVVVKGQESGGRVGAQASFVLLQRLHGRLNIPYWVRGGISEHTAAAAVLAGARGVVISEQLWLAKESPLTGTHRKCWERLDGSETVLIGDRHHAYRFFSRSGRQTLAQLAKRQQAGEPWVEPLREALLQPDSEEDGRMTTLVPLGEEIAFASGYAKKQVTTGCILAAFRKAMGENVRLALSQRALDEGAPLAEQHGTRYPVVQGPMTRVSDTAAFADAVARNGGLPTIALAMLRKPEVESILEQTKRQFADRPWGVGLLGFLPDQLRAEQMEVVRQVRPRFAVIAGGRPSQAAELEALGISTYLHMPSPGLLEASLRDGACKFIFEGRECGGHVGPRSSFTLWSSAIEVLLRAEVKEPSKIQVLFAGGIHDRLSAAMVGAIAAGLVARGMKIGVLVGTAYVMTPEAVAVGAVTEEFLRQAVACRETVLLESGVGHASRCSLTPFAEEFLARKRELAATTVDADQTRLQLELLNLGRLRLASKGLKRVAEGAGVDRSGDLVEVSVEDQRREGMYMIGEVATLRDKPQAMAELHSDMCRGSVEMLKQFVEDRRGEPTDVRVKEPGEPLAIVGMSCLLPESESPKEYWQNILQKFDAVREVPDDRWDTSVFYNEDRLAPDQIYSKWGAFLGEVVFDPFKYRIPPNSLRSIEPIQLLSLEVAWRALEDAGYFERNCPRDRTAVIFGVAGPHALGMAYGFRTMLRQRLAEAADELSPEVRDQVLRSMEARLPVWTEDSFAGFLNNLIAGRISNHLDLTGPNFVVDAACAASLAAVHTAVEQLRMHTCDVALVGGADATNNPMGYMSFSKTHALSPTGKPRPFDDRADGIALGEGVAAIVMKRLRDAEREGDKIYAILRGIGCGSDGRNRSVTAPHAPGQMLTLRRAYEDAGVSPASLSLIEAHGTGTAVGDRVEIEALDSLWQEASAPLHSCAVGSVKSMIGHTKTTAGIAGLIKTVLALKHKVLPPTINVETPNSQVDFSRSPFYVNSESRPWIRRDAEQPRRAGVSAFGFGGTNFHAVLEEYTGEYYTDARLNLSPRPAEIFFWAESDRTKLVERLQKLDKQLEQSPGVDLAQLAYSVYQDNKFPSGSSAPRPCRLGIVATDHTDLRKKLQTAAAQIAPPLQTDAVSPDSPDRPDHFESPSGVYFEASEGKRQDQVCFVVPGHGAQCVNMLKELLLLHPDGLSIFEKADWLLERFFEQPLSSYIYPPPAFNEADRKQQEAALEDTSVAQPALSAVGLFALDVLRRYNLKPAFAAGNSHGEYVALHVAGCLSEEELLEVSALRGKAAKETSQERPGAMAAVFADRETAEAALKELEIPVQVSNINAPKHTVIAGPAAAVDRAIEELPKRKLRTRRLPVAAAFHTSAVQPMADRAAEYLEQVDIHAPHIPVYSCATGKAFSDDAASIRDLMVRQCTTPVRFVEQIEGLYEAGARIFIEMGAGNIATNYVGRILEGKPHETIPLDMPGRGADAQLAHLLARCAKLGLPVALDAWFAGRGLVAQSTAEYLAACHEKTKPMPTHWIVNPQCARQADAPIAFNGSTNPPLAQGHHAMTATHSHRSNDSAAPSKPQASNGTTSRIAASTLFQPADGKNAFSGGAVPSSGSKPGGSGEAVIEAGAAAPEFAVTAEAAPAPVSTDTVTTFQGHMSEWLKLQRHQLRVMERFLSVQEQMLQLPGSRPSAPGSRRANPAPVVLPAACRPAEQEAAPQTAAPRPRVVPTPVLRDIAPMAGTPSGTAERSVRNGHAPAQQFDPQRAVPKEEKTSQPALGRPTVTAVANRREPTADEIPSTHEVASKEQFREELLKAASERTGYPVEMLDENLLMEADLGIDSIKRIEIFSELKGHFVFFQYKKRTEEEILNAFTSLKTLDDIVQAYERERTEYLTFLGKGEAPEGDSPGPLVDTTEENLAETGEEIQQVNPKQGDAPTAAVRSASVAHPHISSEPEAVGRFLVRVKDSPLEDGHTEAKSVLPAGQAMLVLGGLTGSEAMLSHFEQPICHVTPGRKAARLDKDRYQVDFASPASLKKLHEQLRSDGIRIGGIVNLLGLIEPFVEPGPSGQDTALELTTWLLNIAKEFETEILESAKHGGGRLINVTSMGGQFGLGAQGPIPLAQAATVGFCKSLKHEWPEVRVKNIDLALHLEPQYLLSSLAAEMFAADDEIEVGLGEKGRRTVEIVADDLTPDRLRPLDLSGDSVIVVTGGARGITAEITKALAGKYRCRFVLVGRSPEPHDEPADTRACGDEVALKRYLIEQAGQSQQPAKPAEISRQIRRILRERELRRNLDVLRGSGATIDYRPLDICDSDALASLIDEIYRHYGRIDGVIHGAGVIEDKRIADKSPEALARVMRTKIDGANVLARKLDGRSLKFFYLFSSVAGRFGNRGQTDYGAANEYLNKLADQLQAQWSARVVAINWGPWDRGFVGPHLAELFSRHNIHVMPAEQGVECFLREIEAQDTAAAEILIGCNVREMQSYARGDFR